MMLRTFRNYAALCLVAAWVMEKVEKRYGDDAMGVELAVAATMLLAIAVSRAVRRRLR